MVFHSLKKLLWPVQHQGTSPTHHPLPPSQSKEKSVLTIAEQAKGGFVFRVGQP